MYSLKKLSLILATSLVPYAIQAASGSDHQDTSQTITAIHQSSKRSNKKLELIAPVNINSADCKTLKSIPGMSSPKAKAIIKYRTQNGDFKSIDELEKVKGFKSKETMEKFSKYFTV